MKRWSAVCMLWAATAIAGCGGSSTSSTSTQTPQKSTGIRLIYRAVSLTARAPNSDELATTAAVLRQRLHALFPGSRSTVSTPGDRVLIDLPGQSSASVARVASSLVATARLGFYDWEGTVLDRKGRTVASQLASQDPAAVTLSQGGGGGAPGEGAGGLTLYDAVVLASYQPAGRGESIARARDEYYAFGAPNSPACARAAAAQGIAARPNVHCLLAGPVLDRRDVAGGLAAGVTLRDARVVRVRPGTTVLQAAPSASGHQISAVDPSALFYVLHDQVSLAGTAITNPRPSANAAGSPDVVFSFTRAGQAAFQRVTAQIARRGNAVSGLGQQLNQHFAVALDDQLITVPSIDSRTYPDGIVASEGADITGGFTVASARALATQLRIGPLPLRLELIRMVKA